MSCFPSGPLPPREPVLLDADGRSMNAPTLHIGIAATDALLRATRTLFAPGPLVTLTDDPPRADESLAWKFRHGTLGDAPSLDWFADPDEIVRR